MKKFKFKNKSFVSNWKCKEKEKDNGLCVKLFCQKGWYSSLDYKTCAFCIGDPALSCLEILGFAMYFYNLLLGQYSEKSWYVLIQVMLASDFFKFWRLFWYCMFVLMCLDFENIWGHPQNTGSQR